MKLLAKNRRARFDYAITDTLVAGVVLTGAEVKSIKQMHASLKGSFITIRDGEAWLHNTHITPYQHAPNTQDPARPRKLLLHKKQIHELANGGMSLVPLALLQERSLVKVEIGIGKGKKNYDKRATIKKRDVEREIGRKLKT